MSTIGITGTNGKTTSAYLTAFLLERAGIPSGRVGTVGDAHSWPSLLAVFVLAAWPLIAALRAPVTSIMLMELARIALICSCALLPGNPAQRRPVIAVIYRRRG